MICVKHFFQILQFLWNFPTIYVEFFVIFSKLLFWEITSRFFTFLDYSKFFNSAKLFPKSILLNYPKVSNFVKLSQNLTSGENSDFFLFSDCTKSFLSIVRCIYGYGESRKPSNKVVTFSGDLKVRKWVRIYYNL